MNDAADTTDTRRCPLCGGDNRCVMACAEAAKAQGGGTCWCVAARFTPELQAQVPPGLRNRACICQRCAQAAECRRTA